MEVNRCAVKVLLPLKLEAPFDYASPCDLPIGTFAEVPLGRRRSVGVVWPDSTPPFETLKPVLATYDCPALPRVSIDFIDFMADYTLTPKGTLLNMVIPLTDALDPPEPIPLYDLSSVPAQLTAPRKKVIDYLTSHPCQTLETIKTHTGVSKPVLKVMIEKGILEVKGFDDPYQSFDLPNLNHKGPDLNPSQREAADHLRSLVRSGESSTVLLDGVTGSGKTEVYYEAILEALNLEKQALILLPEIALSTQWLERFENRFGVKPAVWHSDLTPSIRRKTWRAIIEGKAHIIVGARSALFLPYPQLGVIIVDEEHDGSYKQEEGVIYNGRDMAVVRAHLGKIPCILASATPSLETLINVQSEKYDILHLESRFGGAQMPDIHVIDLKRARENREINSQNWIAHDLREALRETYNRREQSLLFLNRRGFAPLTLCGSCGERIVCDHCATALVQHRFEGKLMCHHCGITRPLPPQCPECHEENAWVMCGPGVERIAEEVKTFLPEARVEIMTSDTLTSSQHRADVLNSIDEGRIDIIVGTQVMAKGYHFPNLTLVGVVDADMSLSTGDLRAAEKTYQLLHQVAGRSGRSALKGAVWIQTYNPNHPVIEAVLHQDRDRFLEIESEERKAFGFPPYGRLIALIISGKFKADVEAAARILQRAFPTHEDVEMLGPNPAPFALLRGRHRYRILLKSRRTYPLQKHVQHWLHSCKIPASVRIQIDVDPYSFF